MSDPRPLTYKRWTRRSGERSASYFCWEHNFIPTIGHFPDMGAINRWCLDEWGYAPSRWCRAGAIFYVRHARDALVFRLRWC